MSYTNGLDKPTDYFNTVLYTGDASSDRTITNTFGTDFLWLKERNGGDHHQLWDKIRGDGKRLQSNLTNAESDLGTYIALVSTGFKVSGGTYNNNGSQYAGWQWKANGSGSSNTDGSITSTVSANTTSGFSIVSYTGNGTNGATVGHGIDTPDMMIIKNRSSSSGWTVYHTSTGNSGCTFLNSTDAFGDYGGGGYLRNPSSSTFETYFTGSGGSVNVSSENFIAYCFAEKKGFSKFGSYVGNGNADGNFVYLGFKPAWVLVKNSSLSGENWVLLDNKRDIDNPTNLALFPNLSNAESGTYPFDFVSNGFKIRDTSASYNRSGDVFIFMAFAESPFTTSTGIPTTAR